MSQYIPTPEHERTETLDEIERSIQWVSQHNFGTVERPLWLEASVKSTGGGELVFTLAQQDDEPRELHKLLTDDPDDFRNFLNELAECDRDEALDMLDETCSQLADTLAAGMGDFLLGTARLASMRMRTPAMDVGQESLVKGGKR